jgi:hypothetical protein
LESEERKPEDEEIAPQGDLVAPEDENARDDVVLVGQDGRPDDEVVLFDANLSEKKVFHPSYRRK